MEAGKKTKNDFKSTLKSEDTEEWLDIHFYRPIGYRWALLFRTIGFSPNMVTILSMILFVASSIFFYYPDWTLNAIGVLLLIWANMYDSADGQLARLTGKKTQLGRILDGFAGTLWAISLYVCLCLRLQPQYGWWIWLLGIWSGLICHAEQCRLADYYRNIHLYFLKGSNDSEFDNSQKQMHVYHTLRWKDNFLSKMFQFFYVNYTRSQERITPTFQQFITQSHERFSSKLPPQLRTDFCQGSRPLMKYANALTFNFRAIVLCLSVLIGLPILYMIFEIIVLGYLFYYMHYRHESLCASLIQKLDSYEE